MKSERETEKENEAYEDFINGYEEGGRSQGFSWAVGLNDLTVENMGWAAADSIDV